MNTQTMETAGTACRWALLAVLAGALLAGDAVVLAYMGGLTGGVHARVVAFDNLVQAGEAGQVRGRLLGGDSLAGNDLMVHCEGVEEVWNAWQFGEEFGSVLCPPISPRSRQNVAGLPHGLLAFSSDVGHLLSLPAETPLVLVDVRWMDRCRQAGLADEVRLVLRKARRVGELAYLHTGSIRAAAQFRDGRRRSEPRAVVIGRRRPGQTPEVIVHRVSRILGNPPAAGKVHVISDDPALARVCRRYNLILHWTRPADDRVAGENVECHPSLPKLAEVLDDIARKRRPPQSEPSAPEES